MTGLQAALDEYQAVFRDSAPRPVRKVMERASQTLANRNASANALRVGDKAPDFELPESQGGLIHLSTYLKEGPLVLTFYRGAWCPYCNLELQALQEALPDIQATGSGLVAISPQLPDRSLTTKEMNNLQFPVLSDVGNLVAREYGLVFTLDEQLRPIYAEMGIDVPASNGDATFDLPFPATYVIDRDGVIRFAFVNEDYRQRAEPSDIVQTCHRLERNG